MEQRFYKTELGTIAYWVSYASNLREDSYCSIATEVSKSSPRSDAAAFIASSQVKQDLLGTEIPQAPWLIFLPGLTADHQLFNRQLSYFTQTANCFVWDPPAHGKSRPFKLEFSLDDLASQLYAILQAEHIYSPILIGQSMGGYISQAFLSLFPGYAKGFVSIDSAPLSHSYYHNWEIESLKHTKGLLSSMPWKMIQRTTAKKCSRTLYGQSLMRKMINHYSKKEFCELVSHGYRILAEAIEKTKSKTSTNPFERPSCPTLLLWGEKDQAAMTKKYNQQWALKTGLSFVEIPRAGHNSNTDAPDEVNRDIEIFISELVKQETPARI